MTLFSRLLPLAIAPLYLPPAGGSPLLQDAAEPPLLEARVREADDARFRLPTGWKVGSTSEGKEAGPYLELNHDDGDGGISKIIFLKTRSASSQLPKLARTTLTNTPMGFELEEDDVTVAQSRQRYPVAYARSYNRPESLGVGLEGRVFVMKPKSDVHVVFYISSADGIEEYQREEQLVAFIRELRFASAKDPMFDPLEPRESRNPLSVLAFTSGMSLMPNAFGGMDTDVTYDYYGFLPNGRYTELIPESGRLEDADWKQLQKKDPESIGVYRVRRRRGSDKARLELTSTDKYGFLVELEGEVEFEARGEGEDRVEVVKSLKIDGDSQILIEPAQKQRLSGTYTYLYASSGSNAFSSGGISSTRTIRFRRTGSFRSSSFFASSFSNEIGGPRVDSTSSSKKPATGGKYELNGYTLTLRYDEGAVAERFCHLVGDDENLLLLDESPYLRQGRSK